ncbi:unnamed protein product [Calypogeia fissa]
MDAKGGLGRGSLEPGAAACSGSKKGAELELDVIVRRDWTRASRDGVLLAVTLLHLDEEKGRGRFGLRTGIRDRNSVGGVARSWQLRQIGTKGGRTGM